MSDWQLDPPDDGLTHEREEVCPGCDAPGGPQLCEECEQHNEQCATAERQMAWHMEAHTVTVGVEDCPRCQGEVT